MSLTPSLMVELGTKAPEFNLINVDNSFISLKDFDQSKFLLVSFICNHCPYVIHINSEIVKLSNDYKGQGLSFVAISSNDVENYPDDSPDKMKIIAKENKYEFPYLYDETQEVAKAYNAACTPDFFLYNENRELVYRGQLDASRPGNDVPLSGSDLRKAIDALINNSEIPKKQIPSVGCNIKWKKN